VATYGFAYDTFCTNVKKNGPENFQRLLEFLTVMVQVFLLGFLVNCSSNCFNGKTIAVKLQVLRQFIYQSFDLCSWPL